MRKGTNRISFTKALAISDVLKVNISELAGQNGFLKVSKAFDGIDFKLMDEFSRIEESLKPSILAIIRQINNGFRQQRRK